MKPRRPPFFFLPVLSLALGVYAAAAAVSQRAGPVAASPALARAALLAQTDAAGTFQRFVAAINNGELAAAAQLLAPSMTLTLPNGVSVPAGQYAPLAALGGLPPVPATWLPVTIVSVSPDAQDSQAVDAVLTFGADPTPQQVQVESDGGQITAIRVLGP